MTHHPSTSKTGGQLVVDALRALGVEYVFGVPGGQTLAITDAIIDTDGIEFVTARHEGAAAVMADAVGRLTGTPGVCLATTGPGATNLLTGVGGALRDSSPVIVLTCNNRLRHVERDDAQNADHVSIFRPLTKWTHFVADGSTIPRVLAEAGGRAVSGNPGPVLVDFARDAVESEITGWDPSEVPTSTAVLHRQRPLGDPERVDEIAELMRSAARPVLWAGNGVQLSGAGDEVLALAEQLEAPVVTTFNSIGAFPTAHPHVFGPMTRMGTRLAATALAGADLVVALGNSMNAISTARWNLQLPERIVQVDIDPETLGRNYPARTHGVVGDVKAVVGQLRERLPHHPSDVEGRRGVLERLRDAKQAWWASAHASIDRERTPMSPADLVLEVRARTPDDGILVVDAGNPGVWSYLWEVRRPDSYLKPVGFGNMGFAVPATVAAGLVAPDRPVVALVGDGSLGMTLGELATVVATDRPACIVVMNDGAYGNIRQEQHLHFGADREIGVDLGEVDFATVAEGFGLAAERARTLDELGKAVAGVLATGRPGLVDARIDPDESAWTHPLFSRDVEPV
jgi:acetolactate synthase I/II/III large subunit